MRHLQAADEAIERSDAEGFSAVLGELLEVESVREALHETVHGLARGVTVHVLPEDEGLSPAASAKQLGVSRTVVRKLMESGELPYRMKVGTDHRIIDPADVVAVRRRHEMAQTLASSARRATAAAEARGLHRAGLAERIAARDADTEALDKVDRLLAQAAEPDADVTATFLRVTDAAQ